MMKHINAYNDGCKKVMVSIELEKPNLALFQLVPSADVVFVGKDFSAKNGWTDMEQTMHGMKNHVKEG